MQYLVIFSPKKEFTTNGMPSDFMDKEQREQEQVRVLYATGGLRQVWAQVPRTHGGVILFEADSAEQLHEMINSFPLIKANYADPQIVPLQSLVSASVNPRTTRPGNRAHRAHDHVSKES